MNAANHASLNHPVPGWGEKEQSNLLEVLKLAFAEDIAGGDVTTNLLVSETAQGKARLVVRESGVIAGLPAAKMAYLQFDQSLSWNELISDGTFVKSGDVVAEVSGAARSLLTCERIALNLLGRLSGIATQTKRYVDEVQATKAEILDTRKTTPGWRYLEKYAVRVGGGKNHRVGLFDAVLIKDNHLAFKANEDRNDLSAAIQTCREQVPAEMIVEIEVDTLAQLEQVLPASPDIVLPDIVLLDNMDAEQLARAVELRNQKAPQVLLEASGGITLANLKSLAESGVDRISIGALTHSVANFDIGLDWVSE